MISPKFTTDRIKLNVKIMIYMAGRMMNHAKIAKIGPKNDAKNMSAPPRSPTKRPKKPNIIAPEIAPGIVKMMRIEISMIRPMITPKIKQIIATRIARTTGINM
jgi:hypothetical protein